MKIGLIGLGGFGGNAKLNAWRSICDEINHHLYVCDTDLKKLNNLIYSGIVKNERVFSDYKYLISEVDVVDITTPTETHYEIAKYALNNNKHVFVEKPMTVNLKEAVCLQELVEKSDKILQVGYHFRYANLTNKLKELISEGSLGELWEIEGRHVAGKRPRRDGGAILSCGIHFIDLILYLVGDTVESVLAVSKNFLPRVQTPNEDLSYVHLKFNNGILATVKSSVIDYATGVDAAVPGINANWDFFVSGSKGRAYADYTSQKLVLDTGFHEKKNGVWQWVSGERFNVEVKVQNSYELELKAFLKHINNKETPRANVFSSGVYLQKVLDAIYKSAEEGKEVVLNV